MRKYALWVGAVLVVGVALVVRLLYTPPEDAHARHHAEEARAVLEIDALANLPEAEQRARLRTYLLENPSTTARAAAVQGVARLQASEARTLLTIALADYASPVRVRAAEVAAQLPRAEASPLLLACLVDHDTIVRQTAIMAVQRLRERRAVPLLIRLLQEDTNEQTQHLAIGALRSITGQRYYARFSDPPAKRAQARQQWLAWWATARRNYETVSVAPYHPQRSVLAPDLVVRTLEGEPIALRRPPKLLLVNFWGTWCAGCQEELPHLIALHRKYGDRLLILGIAFDEPEGEAGLRRFCQQKGIEYPQALGTKAISEAFDLHGVPQTVLIDTQGNIRFWWEGARDLGTFERALQVLLQSQ
ncbi:MAG: HEAT repeat domain-containing protein [Armatimonadota bacterium]|nr:HEAT repeat domain-containing protein [Armatimonadota bacterium]